jgi:hypothetical protein
VGKAFLVERLEHHVHAFLEHFRLEGLTEALVDIGITRPMDTRILTRAEFIQHEATAERVSAAARELLQNSRSRKTELVTPLTWGRKASVTIAILMTLRVELRDARIE